MIDIKRQFPRFNVNFKFLSNNLDGIGINISSDGIGFLTNEEIVPAEDIPFAIEIKDCEFSNKSYKICGHGRILYSTEVKNKIGSYRNGLQFILIDDKYKNNLNNLLNDIKIFNS